MKLSFTIPQLFYDIIARVLPGFLFLVLLHFITIDYNLDVFTSFLQPSNNLVVSLGNGIVIIIICYFIGVLFTSLIKFSSQDPVKEECKKKLHQNSGKKDINEMYQSIRLENESAGFRLVKLRAEARFIEISRTITGLNSIILFLVIALELIGVLRIPNFNYDKWSFNLAINLIFSLMFYLQEKPAWKRYYGNIIKIYNLLEDKNAAPKCIKNLPRRYLRQYNFYQ